VIDGHLIEELFERIASIDASMKKLVAIAERRAAANQPKQIASDRDLDGKYGNPVIKFDPRDWSGDSMKGRPMSECPPDFLEMLAETFDYFAAKADENNETTSSGRSIASYKRADAARARGWAKRNRERGVTTPAASEAPRWADEGSATEWASDGDPDSDFR
jgi:hypothetical protein